MISSESDGIPAARGKTSLAKLVQISPITMATTGLLVIYHDISIANGIICWLSWFIFVIYIYIYI